MSKILQTFIILSFVAMNSLVAITIESTSPGFAFPGQTMNITVDDLNLSQSGSVVAQFQSTFDDEPVNAQIITIQRLGQQGKFDIVVSVPYLASTISIPSTVRICSGDSGCSPDFIFNYLPPTNIPGITSIFPSIVVGNTPVNLSIKGVNLEESASRFTIFGSNHFSCTSQQQPSSYVPQSDIFGTLNYNALNLFFICSQRTQKIDVTLPTGSPNIYSPPGRLVYIDPSSISDAVEITSAIIESRNDGFVLIVEGTGLDQVRSFKVRFSNNLFINANNFTVTHCQQLDRVVLSLPSDLFDPDSEGVIAARDKQGQYSTVLNIDILIP